MNRPLNFFVGVDLGESVDYTAVALLERVVVKGDWDPVVFAHRERAFLRLRHLERVALGTSYPEVVKRVAHLTRQLSLRARCELLVDATGVGRPVVEMLRDAGTECGIKAAVVTAGIAETYGDGYYKVPKRDLMSGVQVAMQQRTLQFAAQMPLLKALKDEMASLRVKITPAGNEQFGASGRGKHDDLLFAVALGCWGAKKAFPGDWNVNAGWWRTDAFG